MKSVIAISLSCLCAGAAFAGDDSRWVPFKPGHNSQGALEHQIDRNTIRQEGPYKIFWTRVWVVKNRQPLVFSTNEQLMFLSEKFAVDCAAHRFATRFIDSNQPEEQRRKTSIAAMRWDGLDKFPAVSRTVCGYK
jgi:hypothetical protein